MVDSSGFVAAQVNERGELEVAISQPDYIGRHRANEDGELGQECPVRVRRQLAAVEAEHEAAMAALATP